MIGRLHTDLCVVSAKCTVSYVMGSPQDTSILALALVVGETSVVESLCFACQRAQIDSKGECVGKARSTLPRNTTLNQS